MLQNENFKLKRLWFISQKTNFKNNRKRIVKKHRLKQIKYFLIVNVEFNLFHTCDIFKYNIRILRQVFLFNLYKNI